MNAKLEARDYLSILKVYLAVYVMIYFTANFLSRIDCYYVAIAVGMGLSFSGFVLAVREISKERPSRKSLRIFIEIPSLLIPITALIMIFKSFA